MTRFARFVGIPQGLVAVLLLVLAASGVSATQRRVAIAIGFEGYKDPHWPALPGTVNDAVRISQRLKAVGYTVFLMVDHQVEGVEGIEAVEVAKSKEDVEQQLKIWMSEDSLDADDTLLFFYSGHGIAAEGGDDDFLAPVNATTTEDGKPVYSQLVSVAAVKSAMVKTRAGQLVIIADACRNRAKGAVIGSGFGEATQKGLTEKRLVKDGDKPQVVALMRSCHKEESSYCGNDGQGSIFTSAICAGLDGGVAGTVDVQRLSEYVRDKVLEETQKLGVKQVPTLATEGEDAGRIVVAEGVRSKTAPIPAGELAAAIKAAKPGDTLHLAGEYTLNARLDIDKELTLIGSGMDSCKIKGEASSNHKMVFLRGGPVSLKGITFEYTGSEEGVHCVWSECALSASECKFTGASGDGLSLNGKCDDTIRDCVFEHNNNGLKYIGTVGGTASDNICRNNRDSGIVVAGSHNAATPTLDGNTCEGNKIGIYCSCDGAVLRGNKCEGNANESIFLSNCNPNCADNEGEITRYEG